VRRTFVELTVSCYFLNLLGKNYDDALYRKSLTLFIRTWWKHRPVWRKESVVLMTSQLRQEYILMWYLNEFLFCLIKRNIRIIHAKIIFKNVYINSVKVMCRIYHSLFFFWTRCVVFNLGGLIIRPHRAFWCHSSWCALLCS